MEHFENLLSLIKKSLHGDYRWKVLRQTSGNQKSSIIVT